MNAWRTLSDRKLVRSERLWRATYHNIVAQYLERSLKLFARPALASSRARLP